MQVKFVAPARREFLQQVLYYHQQEPGLGAAFALEIEAATARALAFPEAGSPASTNTRRVFVNKFPFSVVYRPDHEGIVVFAVVNHSRKPNYWASRA
ncbi:type II toxin-antitoxin system RelE/ParE family toxin [Alkalimonas delamerensis]|uniref:Type II toxin-antitoxin system RelE/ParE family toxin n=1 Tax=Alkalimonas delamerensis TaxID=265981 RepID=A0ABT9GSC1_9GAMM|nr:type II toxin-antitoxin system RelE/ParE family toxin [Alkalimonas delamerensis]MDP4529881.1 type II toxin-antitoxin system RelE/ParE family toxin [Alkalimonas delamerensis]